MSSFKNSDRNNQSVDLIDDARLDTVVGGATGDFFSNYIASHAVGGWVMKDIWTKPTLGTYH
jgi:hypothetical protein